MIFELTCLPLELMRGASRLPLNCLEGASTDSFIGALLLAVPTDVLEMLFLLSVIIVSRFDFLFKTDRLLKTKHYFVRNSLRIILIGSGSISRKILQKTIL